MAVWPFSSTFSLPIFAFPAYSSASWSMIGVIWRQGPHQVAQKSTRTGVSDLRTSASQAASVKFSVLTPAIFLFSSYESLDFRAAQKIHTALQPLVKL